MLPPFIPTLIYEEAFHQLGGPATLKWFPWTVLQGDDVCASPRFSFLLIHPWKKEKGNLNGTVKSEVVACFREQCQFYNTFSNLLDLQPFEVSTESLWASSKELFPLKVWYPCSCHFPPLVWEVPWELRNHNPTQSLLFVCFVVHSSLSAAVSINLYASLPWTNLFMNLFLMLSHDSSKQIQNLFSVKHFQEM